MDRKQKFSAGLDDEFMSLSIPDGNKAFALNDERIVPGISIGNSEVGIASLSIAAFLLRIVCTNGLISKTAVSSSYRHVSLKVLSEFPDVLKNVSSEFLKQKDRLKISLESTVENPESTIDSFNRQFQLSASEKEAVTWAFPLEFGTTMFNVVNTYTRAAQYTALSAESQAPFAENRGHYTFHDEVKRQNLKTSIQTGGNSYGS